MPSSPRLPVMLALREQLGIEQLARVEAEAVRRRDVPRRLVERLARAANANTLTPRQREVMVLLASGFSRQEIADELGVSIETVKSHLRRSYIALGVARHEHTGGQARMIEAVNAFLEGAA